MKNTVSPGGLARLSEFIAARMGLYFPPERWAELERNIMPAAREFDFTDTEAFIRWLTASALTTEQLEILTSCLTVNETYFWREPEVFQALTEKILPEIIGRKTTGEKFLRIWSAGCSTGEEPYSLAIALRRALPAIKDWKITILATDISPRILRTAAGGVYGEWSFRNAPAWLKKEYFRRRQDGKYEINADIKKMVVFAYLNLAEDIYPTPVNNTGAMDLIFCRNVLMYFVPGRGEQAAQKLYKSLVDGGYFMVSACELSQARFPQFTPVYFPGAIVYRKDVGGFVPAAAPEFGVSAEIHPDAELPPAAETGSLPEFKIARPAMLAPSPPQEAAAPAVPAAAAVRALANEGKLSLALAQCESALLKEKLNPALHYLRAAILQEQNREAEAIAAIQRALYLDPDLVLAHFTLGNLMLRQGNIANTKKSFRNALSLLEKLEQDDIIPESDGQTAGRFREIIDATLRAGVPA